MQVLMPRSCYAQIMLHPSDGVWQEYWHKACWFPVLLLYSFARDIESSGIVIMSTQTLTTNIFFFFFLGWYHTFQRPERSTSTRQKWRMLRQKRTWRSVSKRAPQPMEFGIIAPQSTKAWVNYKVVFHFSVLLSPSRPLMAVHLWYLWCVCGGLTCTRLPTCLPV